MATERTLRFGIDARDARRGARQFERATDKVTRSARGADGQVDNLERGFGRLRTGAIDLRSAFIGLGSAIGAGALLRGLVEINREFQRLRAQLITVEGSLSGAEDAFARIEEFAVSTPFQIEELTEAFTQLRVRGAQPTGEELTALGNLASAFGRNITEVTRAVNSAVAGETETLRRLGFQVSNTGEQITLGFQGMETTVTRTTDNVVDAITRLTGDRLAGAMEREMNTINGAISNLFDNVGRLARAIGSTGGLNAELTAAIGRLRDMIGALADNEVAVRSFTQTAIAGARALVQPFITLSRLLFNLGQNVGEAANALGALLVGNFQEVRAASQRIEDNWRDMADALNTNKDAWTSLGGVISGTTADMRSDVESNMQAATNAVENATSRLDEFRGLAGTLRFADTVTFPNQPPPSGPGRLPVPNVPFDPGPQGGGRDLDLRQLDQAVRAVASLADASGELSDEARGAVRGLSDVIGGLQGLQGGGGLLGSITGLAGVFGGAISIFQSVASLLEDNTAAIRENTHSLGLSERARLAQQRLDAQDITDPTEAFQALLEQLQSQVLSGTLPGPESILLDELGPLRDFVESIQNLGMENVGEITTSLIDAALRGDGQIADFLEQRGLAIEDVIDIVSEMERLGDEAGRAADGMNDLAGALRNVPGGFKIALRRFQATDPVIRGESDRATDTDGGGMTDFTTRSFTTPITTGLTTLDTTVDTQTTEIQRGNSRIVQAIEQLAQTIRSDGGDIVIEVDGSEIFRVVEKEARTASARGGLTSLTNSPRLNRAGTL